MSETLHMRLSAQHTAYSHREDQRQRGAVGKRVRDGKKERKEGKNWETNKN